MSKSKQRHDVNLMPEWKSFWPSTGEPKAWFKAGIRKCEAIADDVLACEKAKALVDALGRVGGSAEATKAVDRLLKRVPSNDGNHWYRSLALSGAEAAYKGGDLEKMEKYLAIVAGQNKYLTRPCDLNYPLEQVAEFKIRHGILNPKAAIENGQKNEATFTWHYRLLKTARTITGRQKHLAQMESVVKRIQGDLLSVKCHQDLLREYASIGDKTALKRIKGGINKQLASRVLDYPTLRGMGEIARALDAARAVVKSNLAKLACMDDPHIHFSVHFILSAIRWLAHVQQADVATREFRTVQRNVSKWTAFGCEWITAGVYSYLGEMAMAVEDIDSAREYAYAGLRSSITGKKSAINQSVESSLLKLLCSNGLADEALVIAERLRSPKQKRLNKAKIFVRAKRWKQLRETCICVRSVEEAADLAWRLRFEFPGGMPD